MASGFWLLFAWAWPLLLALPAASRSLWWLPSLGAVPALIIAIALPVGTQVDVPWLLLGSRLGLDTPGRIFLIFTAIVWLAASAFATLERWRSLAGCAIERRRGARFSAFFLLAMAGNFWLILGLDLISFYVGFAIMGLASYVLVIHDGSTSALRAGRVYLLMTLVGEVLLFAALAMIVAETGTRLPTPEQLSALSHPAIALAVLGLSIKAGIFPLHLWLPLAHPAAPIPASAVLSGTMIKVAVLGWLRFLPIGVVALPNWGLVLILAGLITMFFGLGVGLTQRDLKVILAYSSIGKMGFLLSFLGLLLLQPALAPVGVVAIALFAAHHGLVKSGLFLGVELRKHADPMRQPLILAGLVFLGLSMAGAPLTTGAVAKDATKPLLSALTAPWGLWLGAALGLGTIATTALMARFAWLARQTPAQPLRHEAAAEVVWALLIQAIIILPFALFPPKSWLGAPIALAFGLALVAGSLWLAGRGRQPFAPVIGRVPPGDLLAPLLPIYRLARLLGLLATHHWQVMVARISARNLARLRRILHRPVKDPERRLRGWPVNGALWLGLGGLLLLALLPEQDGSRPQPIDAPIDAPRPDQTDQTDQPAPTVAQAPLSVPEPPAATEHIAPPASPMADKPQPAPADMHPSPATHPFAALDSCEPPEPFIFRSAENPANLLELERCVTDESGELQALASPALSNALVLMLQLNLEWLGWDPGSTDGMIGPSTRTAIRAFQESVGMRSTGGVSFELLRAIGQEIAERQQAAE